MRVLIICNDFPPLNSVGALRPYSWFNYFKESGAEPIVITKKWEGNVESPADVLKESSSNEITIENNNHGTIYRVPLKLTPSEKMFVRYGEKKFRLFRRMLTMIYKMLSFSFFSFDKHRMTYEQARKILSNEKIDVILITGEPFILFRYGYLLKKEFGVKWVADYRDAWYLNHVTSLKKDFINRFMMWYEYQFEKKFIHTSDLIITPDPHRKELLNRLHHRKCEIVYNGFEDFLLQKEKNTDVNKSQLFLTHTGTLTAGQRVEFLLQAIAELHNENKIQPGDLLIQFIGLDYYPEQMSRVKNYKPEIENYIRTTARLPREVARQVNQAADFLIAFTEEKNQTLFAKVYDYFAARKTILVLPGDKGLMSEIVSESNSGISFYTVTDLKKFLVEQMEKRKKGEATLSYTINEEKALFYTRKNQSHRLVQFLNQLLNSAA